MQKLPEIAVVGVKKCGTGALIEVLRMHPDIVAPPYEETEVEFWGKEELVGRGLDYYQVSKYRLTIVELQYMNILCPEVDAPCQTKPKGGSQNARTYKFWRQQNTTTAVPSIAWSEVTSDSQKPD